MKINPRKLWALLVVVLFVVALAGVWLFRTRPAPHLISSKPVAAPTKQVLPEKRITKRQRYVQLDANVAKIILKEEKGAVQLELFPGEVVTVDFERSDMESAESATVTGGVRGQPGSEAVLISHKGVVAGSIMLGDGRSFLVNFAGENRHSVVELDPDKMAQPDHLTRHMADKMPRKLPRNTIISMPQLPWNQTIPVPGMPWFTTTLIGTNPWPQGPPVYGPPVVSLMVLYTAKASQELSGLLGVESRIRLAVGQVNAALKYSGTTAKVRLVHSEEIAYNSTGDLQTDLQNMTFGIGPVMPKVHDLRWEHRADLVSLWVESNSQNLMHGTAWMLTSFDPAPAFGFNAIEGIYCNTSVLAHEIGHNLGCNHATNDVGGFLQGAFTNSYGYRFGVFDTNSGVTYNFRTIMAYGAGRQIGYFSNPAINFWGVATGDTNWANNAYTIERTAPMVGSYMSGGYGPPYYAPGQQNAQAVAQVEKNNGQQSNFTVNLSGAGSSSSQGSTSSSGAGAAANDQSGPQAPFDRNNLRLPARSFPGASN